MFLIEKIMLFLHLEFHFVGLRVWQADSNADSEGRAVAAAAAGAPAQRPSARSLGVLRAGHQFGFILAQNPSLTDAYWIKVIL